MAMTRLEQGCSSESTEETHLEDGPNAPPNIAEKEAYHVGLILGKDGVVDLAGFRELSLGLEPHSEETLDAGGVLEALLEAGQAYLRDMRGEEVRGAEEGAENRSVLLHPRALGLRRRTPRQRSARTSATLSTSASVSRDLGAQNS